MWHKKRKKKKGKKLKSVVRELAVALKIISRICKHQRCFSECGLKPCLFWIKQKNPRKQQTNKPLKSNQNKTKQKTHANQNFQPGREEIQDTV